MNRPRTILWVLLMALSAGSFMAFPQQAGVHAAFSGYFTAGDFKYYTVDGETAIIEEYLGSGGAVVVPSSVTAPASSGTRRIEQIAGKGFSGNTKVTSVQLPSTIRFLGVDVFAACRNLKSITLPSGLEVIGDQAFKDCPALTSLSFGNNLSYIGPRAFVGDLSLGKITVDPSNPSYTTDNGALYNKDKTVLFAYPAGRAGTCTLPSTVVTIQDSAFRGCRSLTKAILPAGLDFIGDDAFFGCTALADVMIPAVVTSIGMEAFENCSALTVAFFLGDAPDLQSEAFKNCCATFSVGFVAGSSGFTRPTWKGYASSSFEAPPPTTTPGAVSASPTPKPTSPPVPTELPNPTPTTPASPSTTNSPTPSSGPSSTPTESQPIPSPTLSSSTPTITPSTLPDSTFPLGAGLAGVVVVVSLLVLYGARKKRR